MAHSRALFPIKTKNEKTTMRNIYKRYKIALSPIDPHRKVVGGEHYGGAKHTPNLRVGPKRSVHWVCYNIHAKKKEMWAPNTTTYLDMSFPRTCPAIS